MTTRKIWTFLVTLSLLGATATAASASSEITTPDPVDQSSLDIVEWDQSLGSFSDDPASTPMEVVGSWNGSNPIQSRRVVVGCVQAPGWIGSEQCIFLSGDGNLYVNQLKSGYVTTEAKNVCGATAQFRYKGQFAINYTTKEVSGGASCGWLQREVSTYPQMSMSAGTTACARQKNDATGQAWTTWACVNIF
ncbi:hypothetical protein [Oerskovia sp. Root22]|uniref:hypothetical protein n=1 Tax=Oerskovia sp. Root22 TaxID=1736494 RepID=UPI0006F7ECCB|nr:hypothetical protein [Oerskovia sp. Root22]KRC37539.1 hypothetical protein ASE15_05340 [Oerskovia sp. Root22]